MLEDSVWQKLLLSFADEANKLWSDFKVRVPERAGKISIGLNAGFGLDALVGQAASDGWSSGDWASSLLHAL